MTSVIISFAFLVPSRQKKRCLKITKLNKRICLFQTNSPQKKSDKNKKNSIAHPFLQESKINSKSSVIKQMLYNFYYFYWRKKDKQKKKEKQFNKWK